MSDKGKQGKMMADSEEALEPALDEISGTPDKVEQNERDTFDELRGAPKGHEPTQEELDADPRLARIWLKYINIDSDTAEG